MFVTELMAGISYVGRKRITPPQHVQKGLSKLPPPPGASVPLRCVEPIRDLKLLLLHGAISSPRFGTIGYRAESRCHQLSSHLSS